jgi:hypothetical protein
LWKRKSENSSSVVAYKENLFWFHLCEIASEIIHPVLKKSIEFFAGGVRSEKVQIRKYSL